ncbi:MAG TPA: glycosyltransferase family 9 protein [Acidobacteriaceae bacterium]|nr:glycosyltransferase family 9 protein [Acidobacteriaceae bacterium]
MVAHLVRLLHGSSRFSPAELADIRNFIVLQYESPLGSVVHATPLFEALKRAVPDCHITVAASRMAASVLHANPYIDRCVLTPSPFGNFSGSVRAVQALLESTPAGARCLITTIGNQRTRLAFLSLVAGSAVRIGYTLAPELYDIALDFDPLRGQIEGNLEIARSLGHPVSFYEPAVFFTRQDAERASQWLESLRMDPVLPRIAFVTQNSGGQRNQWSPDRFQSVISRLSSATGAVPVFVGSEKDAIPIDELRECLREKGISLAGKTTIAQLAALLAQCDLIVSLDTGTFHVARAVELPGVVIAPAWQDSREWLPVESERYGVLRGPAIQDIPPGYCMEEISAEQVCGAAHDLLAKFPAAAAERAFRVARALNV